MADFHVFEDTAAVTEAAARLFADLSHQALYERGRFTVALSGGSTPVPLFQRLTFSPWCSAIPWNRTLFFWGDDRAVGPEHEYSNYRMARVTLLDHVPVAEENVIRIRGELGAVEAAKAYKADLAEAFGPCGAPRFDLVIQGVGMDGHTASLFPGGPELEATSWVVPVSNASADPAVDRVTLSLPVFNRARTALFLATGTGKAPVVRDVVNDPAAMDRYPAARVEAEQTLWYVDENAFSLAKKG
ncbi:6-phosphogluconolactonase [Pseudodesulfovibrio sp.]|uniref:6-phosphogluconolactonase n=1 Tax=Pseudodesulfovibrio sp. TaxID=2035812 RepID=UPI002627065B|nr:6-phosphogluconolactonase [Pseudodesulfovibrio sp.]MDD3310490.1 6-phosphogluconolactonase [Pseudodesulfovibrio sp.]